jgi:hypothetical protein
VSSADGAYLGEELEQQAVDLVGFLLLHPVAAVLEDV